MRFRHPDGTVVHLAYCTNVHAAEDLDAVIGQLARYAEPVRRRLGTGRLGLGLWLAAGVLLELGADPDAVRRLRSELAARDLEVVTLNAFPYAGFHQPVVKTAVYKPSWTEPARLQYTVSCARVLADLLPDDVAQGSISTLPLAWRMPWSADDASAARHALNRLASELAAIHRSTGRQIRVGVEPEPGCVIESTEQAVAELSAVDTEWIGVCLDACHLAVGFEDPADAVARLTRAGRLIVKVQAACALEASDPVLAAPQLADFAESRFLHQARTLVGGRRHSADDLVDALDGKLPASAPWRVHFHMPVHSSVAPPLGTTAAVLDNTLRTMFGGAHPATNHVEVETYTWSVLPGQARPPGATGLADGIAAELAWTRDRLAAVGLQEEAA